VKRYPSILRASFHAPPGVDLYTFDKLDGSNLRFEWTRKREWWKYGTRERLFDRTDPDFGPAIDLFLEDLAEPLARLAFKSKWDPFVAFVEFYGERSFAGLHHPTEMKKLALIDVAAPRHTEGLFGPRDYLNVVSKTGVPAPNYLGVHRWNQELLKAVAENRFGGVTFEGVVGKREDRRKGLVMYKTKTDAWRDAIRNKYDEAKARELVDS
jgi:hypothetical protein